MNARGLLNYLRVATTTKSSSRHGFLLFRSFVHTVEFYQGLLMVAFVALVAVLFNHFLLTLQEFILVVTEADEELIAMVGDFVNNGLVWLFVLVCLYAVCSLALTISGARYLQEQARTQPDPTLHKQ